METTEKSLLSNQTKQYIKHKISSKDIAVVKRTARKEQKQWQRRTGLLTIAENGLNLVFNISSESEIAFLHCSAEPFVPKTVSENSQKWFRLLELQCTGENQDDHHGSKHTGTNPAGVLKYQKHRDYRNEWGRKLEFLLTDGKLETVSHLQLLDGIPIIRSWVDVLNKSSENIGLEYVTSFALTGLIKQIPTSWSKRCLLLIPYNSWCNEVQWRSHCLEDLALDPVKPFSSQRVSISNTGTWSTHEYLPMGVLEDSKSGIKSFWQIEHNGSWHWEISDITGHLYLHLSGPCEDEHHWWKQLKPGESFTTVPVAFGSVQGPLEAAFQTLTEYRRSFRRQHRDNEELPVIFNDYMHCLNAEPTTNKLLGVIDKAAKLGCEYFCIDAGWYSAGYWWDGVGEWTPSIERFPNGIEEPIKYIRKRGMIPGLWLEIEVMGIRCPLAANLPDDCFFMKHGKRVIEHSRYLLDFRNKAVIAYVDKVIDRIVGEYGIGYIKMDYNINSGLGTETKANSLGEGLLEHNRTYLAWIDKVFARYPDLIIENCGSGGMRMDYAMLSRHTIQSITDQTDYRVAASIIAGAFTAVTPEQCGIWSYPTPQADEEEVIFNMVNAMLGRIHQSGAVTDIGANQLHLIQKGIACYKQIRSDIPKSQPIWPLGLPQPGDGWLAQGLRCDGKCYLAVWRLETPDETVRIPTRSLGYGNATVQCIYPASDSCRCRWNSQQAVLKVTIPTTFSARVFQISNEA